MSSADAAKPRKKTRVLFTIHKWVALVVALLLIMQAGTGIVLANQDVLLPAFHSEARDLPTDQITDLDRLIANAESAVPGARLDRLLYTHIDDGVVLARIRVGEPRTLHIALLAAHSGEALSTGRVWDYPTQFAERLHVSLVAGGSGQLVLLVEGLLLTFLAISGLILWWPKQSRFAEALTIHWRAPWRRLLRDLHLAPGAIMAAFFAFSGFTGALMIAEPIVKPAVAAIAPVLPDLNPQLPPAPENALPVVTAQQALDAMQAHFPDGELRQIRVLGGGRLTGALFIAEDAQNPRAHHMAGVDRLNGEVIVFADGNQLPAGEAALTWILPLHNGEAFAALRRPVMTLIGLALLLASISGVAMWALKPRRRQRAAQA